MKLSVQIIADFLQKKGEAVYGELADERVLKGFRKYVKGRPVYPQYIYITCEPPEENGAFVVAGTKPENPKYNHIYLPLEQSSEDMLLWVAEAFELYTQWADSLQDALNRDAELEEFLRLSLHIFENPMFLHDSDFYLLAMAGSMPNPDDWIYEQSSGKFLFNSDLISQYKLDTSYLESLKLKGASIFPRVIREYLILICNIWQDDRYIARICINASNTEIKKGQIKLADYLGEIVLIALKREREKASNPRRDITLLLSGMFSGKPESREVSHKILSKQNWNENDSFMIFKIEVSQWDEYVKSVVATCFRLESIVKECFAFPYKNDIAVIVNLTKSGSKIDEVMFKLSPFLRDNMLKVGSSSIFHDFFLSAEYFLQAEAALEIGKKYDDMKWSFKFEHYVMKYILHYGCSVIDPKILCSQDVLTLAEYDEANGTRLLETLKVYVANNLNSVTTAKELFIHRSTFFYRLDRIKSMIKTDLRDYEQRMYLQLSFLLYSESIKQGGNR